jgi:hypothetical protein
MKRALCPALLLLLAAAAAHAAPVPPPTQFLQSLAAPACAAVAPGSALAGALPMTGPECLASFCTDDSQCPCSEASSAYCGTDNVCHYVYPNPGPGGGLGCPAAFCQYDSQCQANCPDGPNSYCATNGTCVYVR